MSTADNTSTPTELRITEAADGSVSVDGFEDEPKTSAAPAATAGAASTEAPSVQGQHDDDDDDDDDSRVVANGNGADALESGAATDEARAQIRERRRQERQERKQRQRERENRLELEAEAARLEARELRRRLEALETRGQGSELAQIDARIAETAQNITYLQNVIRDATAAGNGEALAQATTQLQREVLAETQLKNIREAHANSQPRRALPDPRVVLHGKRWMGEHKWYDPRANDADAQQVMLIDRRLAAEGADPSTPEYWSELSKRVRTALPHRYAEPSGQTEAASKDRDYTSPASHGKPSRSVVTGSGSTGAVGAAPKGYVLSADRVQALKDAGMWDDPKARADAIRRYREHDAQQPRA